MKTLTRVVRRYVLMAVGAVLLIVLLDLALFLGTVFYFGAVRQSGATQYYGSQIAQAFTEEDGIITLPEDTLQNWEDGWAWAMMLDDAGRVVWRHDLPAALDHPYTASEIVGFSRWYLADYPVLSYVTDYGVLVLAKQKGSMVRWNFYMAADQTDFFLKNFDKVLWLNLALVTALALLVGWRSGKALRQVGQGIDALAEGEAISLPEKGMTAELAAKLNRTSARLQAQQSQLARRDAARTRWIAGVSHDIRTPLALIVGYGEQLEGDAALPAAVRAKAAHIGAQGQKIKSLVEDLNLTNKLQYGVQPLRRSLTPAGPLLRQITADFCNGPAACPVEFSLGAGVDRAVLNVDAPLLARALENLLGNSARHGGPGCTAALSAELCGGALCITVTDDGGGYPAAVLAALQAPGQEPETEGPHILGLHVVEQILAAHGGAVRFGQNTPHGAKTALTLPTEPAA